MNCCPIVCRRGSSRLSRRPVPCCRRPQPWRFRGGRWCGSGERVLCRLCRSPERRTFLRGSQFPRSAGCYRFVWMSKNLCTRVRCPVRPERWSSCRLQDMNNLAEMKNDGQIISLSVGKIQHQYFMSCWFTTTTISVVNQRFEYFPHLLHLILLGSFVIDEYRRLKRLWLHLQK